MEYRLAPEHPFPAPLDDVVTAYRALLAEGIPADRIVLGGESAGGGLVLAAMVALREAGEPLPAAAAVFSPWVDLTLAGESVSGKAAVDPILSIESLQPASLWYVGEWDAADPRVSPVFADLSALPPLSVQVGSREVLLDDAVRLAARAAASDVRVTLDVIPGAIHGFEAHEAEEVASDGYLAAAGEFLSANLAG